MAKRVLIVDDHLDVVKMVGLLLQKEGFEIVAAQTGEQALSKARAEKPDVVILDIMIPAMDGYETCRRLRADPVAAHLPILMFTAKMTPQDKVAGFQAGTDDYLTKPIHPSELLARVEAVMLRAARRATKEPLVPRAKIYGFIGAKGGVGTTTLALNVGVVLAQDLAQGKQIILADLQPGMASLALQVDVRPGSLARFLGQPPDNLRPDALEALVEEKTKLKVLSGQIEPHGSARPISRAHAEAILRHSAATADYVLLDLGVGLSEANRYVLSQCHHTVVVTEPQRVSLTLAQALLSEMTQALNLPAQRISVAIVNKVPGASFTRDAIKNQLGFEIAGVVPPAPELAWQAAERGTPMMLLQPDSLASRQIHGVAEFVRQVGV